MLALMAEDCIAAAALPHKQGSAAPVVEESASILFASAQQRAEEFHTRLQKIAGEHRRQHDVLISALLQDIERNYAALAGSPDVPTNENVTKSSQNVPTNESVTKSDDAVWNRLNSSADGMLEGEGVWNPNDPKRQQTLDTLTAQSSDATYLARPKNTTLVGLDELMPTGVPQNLLPFYEIFGSPKDFTGTGARRIWYDRAHEFMLWWTNLQEPPRSGRLPKLIKFLGFEALCILVIMCHAGFLIWGTDYAMQNLNQREPPFLKWVDAGFQTWYMVELSLKLYVHGLYLFVNEDMRFNWFDFFLVGLGTQDVVAALRGEDGDVGIRFSFMRTLRIFRVAKMLRIVKVMHFFRELRLMLVSLVCSFASFVWSALTISFLLIIFALVFVQALTGYLEDKGDTIDEDQLETISRYFGSVKVGMLTLFMAASGGTDWESVYRIIQPTGSGYSLVFIMFITFFFFAVLNVLTGIFCENAMKLASPDRETVILESRRRDLELVSELWEICNEMDLDHSGTIELKEFTKFIDNPKFHRYLAALDINIKDALMFFQMLAAISADGSVRFDDFVHGCMRLKGQASSIDLQGLMFETKLMHRQQSAKFEAIFKMFECMSVPLSAKPGLPFTGGCRQPSGGADQSRAAGSVQKTEQADLDVKRKSTSSRVSSSVLAL